MKVTQPQVEEVYISEDEEAIISTDEEEEGTEVI